MPDERKKGKPRFTLGENLDEFCDPRELLFTSNDTLCFFTPSLLIEFVRSADEAVAGRAAVQPMMWKMLAKPNNKEGYACVCLVVVRIKAHGEREMDGFYGKYEMNRARERL